MGLIRLLVVLIGFAGMPTLAHEFWIEPEQYQVETDAPLAASLRNGENFKGTSLGWFEGRFSRFEMVLGDKVMPVGGRMGDTPALQTAAPSDEGLLVILHETTPSRLTYRDWEKFLKFAAHKDFPTAADFHAEMGWPREGFRESYTRHVKALVAVGDGVGSDRAFGMKTEFVALTNPYEPGFEGVMRVQVNMDDAPRADAQVEVFERRPDGTVDITLHRTDADGQVGIPVNAGSDYLFDAVVLRPNPEAGSEENAPLWRTFWAALTFAVPAR
ncbi:MAG: DUF4198 domain-containing protein [Pseudomonadota bacterium]